jgi:hypothetical protein
MKDPFVIALAVMLWLTLVVFMLLRNKRDFRNLKEKLNNDYHKPKEMEAD